MIELRHDSLAFSFPEVHPAATVSVDFQRTLRIPDDERDYPLPPGLGRFPLRLVDDYAGRLPAAWLQRGGVMLPMFQSEAMWLNFGGGWDDERGAAYPFAIKVATGMINAVSGKRWGGGLHRRPQDYVVVPGQPWLDGYCVEKGVIRQFVAMPLGAGYSAEEQLSGKPEFGGLQVMVVPMKRQAYEKRFPKRPPGERARFEFCMAESLALPCAGADMGLAPGGRMKQEIYRDTFKASDWDLDHSGKCFVHIANSLVWRQFTGIEPPTTPPTAEEYSRAGLPWFLWYDDAHVAVKGSKELAGLKSVATVGKHKEASLPENQVVSPSNVKVLRRGLKKGQVREFAE
jgi:hypothetical protein